MRGGFRGSQKGALLDPKKNPQNPTDVDEKLRHATTKTLHWFLLSCCWAGD